MIERFGEACAVDVAPHESIQEPHARWGKRTRPFLIGNSRAKGPAGAISLVVQAVTGFTNKKLRGQFAGLLGAN
jgi:hypothetical protein